MQCMLQLVICVLLLSRLPSLGRPQLHCPPEPTGYQDGATGSAGKFQCLFGMALISVMDQELETTKSGFFYRIFSRN
jgi:hypothetical protein